MMKPSFPRFTKTPMGLGYSLKEFLERRGRNQRFSPQNDDGDNAPQWVALDHNNSASSQQLHRRQRQNVSQRQSADQSGYYSGH